MLFRMKSLLATRLNIKIKTLSHEKANYTLFAAYVIRLPGKNGNISFASSCKFWSF